MPFHNHFFQVRIHTWPTKSYHDFYKTKNNKNKNNRSNKSISIIIDQ